MIYDTEKQEDEVEDVLSTLISPDNISVKLEIVKDGKSRSGRKSDTPDVPQEIRELIGVCTVNDGPSAAAKAFGIAPSTASNYSHGLVQSGTDRNENQALKDAVEEARRQKDNVIQSKRDTAHERALDALLNSMDLVDEALTNKEMRDAERATRIANNLSGISERMTRKNEEAGVDNRKLIIIAPIQQKIENYEVLDV